MRLHQQNKVTNLTPAAQLMNTFIALVTADGYKKMLSFLDGDPKVRLSMLFCPE